MTEAGKERMMELWDGYHADGSPAECDLIRGEPIPKGLYHLVCEILVRHTDGDYLLMQRDFRKREYGGWYEASAGGSALKGEDKISCVKRELWEETGISDISLEEIGRSVSGDTIYFSFLGITDCDKASVTLQDGETIACRWITEPDFVRFVHSDKMIAPQKNRYLRYFIRQGYIRVETP